MTRLDRSAAICWVAVSFLFLDDLVGVDDDGDVDSWCMSSEPFWLPVVLVVAVEGPLDIFLYQEGIYQDSWVVFRS